MEDSLMSLVGKFEESEEASYSERRLCERDRDYKDGKQLSQEERNTLQERGQPPVVYNRIRRKINYLLGLERQSRKDPKAFPRNPADEAAAQAVTDSLRFVAESEQFDDKRSDAWDNLLVEGTGCMMVGIKQDRYGLTPSLVHVPWDRFFYDPHSRRNDFSDARYMGIVTWYDVDEAKETWPDASDAITQTMANGHHSETYDDRPKFKVWSDRKRARVRVIEIYCLKGGVWHRAVLTQAGFLEEYATSPYLDEEGQPANPIVAMSLYVDRDNNRYGDVRDLIDPQDEINKRRSKGLHLISMRQVRVGPDSEMSPEEIREEVKRPDGVITSTDFDILDNNDMAAQNLNLLQEAKNEIDLLGANAALAGKNENDMSGRAILAQQQGGMVEVALHFDRLRFLTLNVYRAMWARIRQTWDGERWVRVTDDERNIKFVGVNQPVTAAQKMQEQIEGNEQLMQRLQQDPMAQQRLAMFLQSPQAQQVVEVRNVPAETDVDILIDEGMDTPTIQAEQWSELVKLASTGMINIPPDLLIESSQLRDKDKLLEKMQQPDPNAQQAQKVALAKETAEIEKTQSETAENMANAERNQAEAFKAGIEAGMAA